MRRNRSPVSCDMLPNQGAAHNPNNDVEVQNAANDGISCIAWSPVTNNIVAGSWDNEIRCWEVQQSGQAVPKSAIRHDGPVLCASWSNDGARVFTGSCDKTAKVWDLATSQTQQVAGHDQPIKNIAWVQEMNCIATSSWDRTVKYWDGCAPHSSNLTCNNPPQPTLARPPSPCAPLPVCPLIQRLNRSGLTHPHTTTHAPNKR